MSNVTLPPAPIYGAGLPYNLMDWLRQAKLFLSSVNISHLHKTTNIATETVLTVPSDGMYNIGLYAITETNATAGTLVFTISFTDPDSSSAATISHNITTNGSGTAALALQCVAGSTITFASTLAGIVGNPIYSVFLTLQRMS